MAKIVVASGVFSSTLPSLRRIGSREQLRALAGLFNPVKGVRAAQNYADSRGLDGIEIAWQRGLSWSVLKNMYGLKVVGIHGPLWVSREQLNREISFGGQPSNLRARLYPLFSPYFPAGAPEVAEGFAEKNGSCYFILHAGTVKHLALEGKVPDNAKAKWLVEQDWIVQAAARWNKWDDPVFWEPKLVDELASDIGLDLVFDTSRVQICQMKPLTAWESYRGRVEVIQLSGGISRTKQGGLPLHPDYLDELGLREIADFLYSIRNSWDGVISIELSFSDNRLSDLEERLDKTLDFVRSNGF